MDIGIGLDPSLGLSWDQQRDLARQASGMGYASAWTPAGATGRDSLHLCSQWAAAAGGLGTGILVVPSPHWSVVTLAAEAATVGELTQGRFILGIGTGNVFLESHRRTFGLPKHSPIVWMREHLTALRGLLAGEEVTLDGEAVELRGVKLGFKPPRVPVYLAALGPRMLHLAGELADGVAPNWCTPEQVAWCRQHVAEGARAVGRDPASIPIVQYIRVCVDDDVEDARRGLANAVLDYALARPGASKTEGYRGHFGRMGFDEILTELEARRDAGAPRDELAEAMPPELLSRVGYFGPPAGAAQAFKRLAQGLDTAIVRVVRARSGFEAAQIAMGACRPDKVLAA